MSSVIFGLHAVQALVEQSPEKVKELYFDVDRSDSRFRELVFVAEKNNVSWKTASKAQLEKMVGDGKHQGVVARVKETKVMNEADLTNWLEQLPAYATVLVLDGVQDPHNLGACFRVADAAGVAGILVPKDKSVGLTPVVHKVACGATEKVPLFTVTNLVRSFELLKESGFWIYGTAGEVEQSLFATSFANKSAIVMGGEEKGLRRLTREHCDYIISIPMHGSVSSLNVSVSAGVCLFERVRQLSNK